jgi:hypothetical protein
MVPSGAPVLSLQADFPCHHEKQFLAAEVSVSRKAKAIVGNELEERIYV